MYSIKVIFEATQTKYPAWSSYLCFAHTVTGRGLNRQILHKWFNQLVQKDDYALSEKKQVLAHLDSLSNPPMEYAKAGAIAALRPVKLAVRPKIQFQQQAALI